MPQNPGFKIENAGRFMLRFSLVLVLGWIGLMKFTTFEAEAIQPLVASSPFLSWLYHGLSVRGVSMLIGTAEIATALFIALRPFSPKICVVGSALAICTFLTTTSFLFTLPGWEASLGGFPYLSGNGGFLLKDVVLLGASIWSLGEALNAQA